MNKDYWDIVDNSFIEWPYMLLLWAVCDIYIY